MTLLAEFAALAGVPLEYISFEVTEVETDAPLEGGRRRGGNKQLAPLLDEPALVAGGRRAGKGFGKVVEVLITVVIKFVSKVVLSLPPMRCRLSNTRERTKIPCGVLPVVYLKCGTPAGVCQGGGKYSLG